MDFLNPFLKFYIKIVNDGNPKIGGFRVLKYTFHCWDQGQCEVFSQIERLGLKIETNK